MKNIFLFLAICSIFAGCKKTPPPEPVVARWEYKTVTVENFAGYMSENASEETKTNLNTGLEHQEQANAGMGSFDLEFSDSRYGCELYKLGQQGWEMVSAIPLIQTVPFAEAISGETYNPDTKSLEFEKSKFNNIRTGAVVLVFKRPQQ